MESFMVAGVRSEARRRRCRCVDKLVDRLAKRSGRRKQKQTEKTAHKHNAISYPSHRSSKCVSSIDTLPKGTVDRTLGRDGVRYNLITQCSLSLWDCLIHDFLLFTALLKIAWRFILIPVVEIGAERGRT